MKVFKRVRSPDQIQQTCVERGWKWDSRKHDEEGFDHIRIDFALEAVSGHLLFNAFNGRFFGELKTGVRFDSNVATHEACDWFQELLKVFYAE